MLIDESDIEIKCPGCKDKFVDARLLPCGKSLCIYCIQPVENSTSFKCVLCNETHHIPPSGFPLNDSLNDQIKKKLKSELNKKENDFKRLLDQIEKTLHQTEFDMSNGDYIVKEHCRELRRQVQLIKEIKIEEINKLSDEMLVQIDWFEREKTTNYTKLNTNDLDAKIGEIKEDLKKWNSNLHSFEITQEDIDTVTSLKHSLIRKKEEYLSRLYEDKLMEFYKRADEPNVNCFGRLVLSSFSSIDFNQLEKINFSSYFDNNDEIAINDDDDEDNGYFKIVDTLLLDNNDYLILAEYADLKEIRCLLFDENKLLKKKKSINADACGTIYSSASKICIHYGLSKKNYLSVLDENLDELTRQAVENTRQRLVGANSKFIFMTNDDKTESCPLFVYDWSLNLLKQLGQRNNPKEAYYLSSNVYHFEIRNHKCYIIQNDKQSGKQLLRIIDETNGLTVNVVQLEKISMFFIDDDDRLVLVDQDRLVFLDQNGRLLREIGLVNFPDYLCSYFTINSSYNLCVFDDENYWLSIRKIY